MITATIKIDKLAYKGEDLDKTYESTQGVGGGGWHPVGHHHLDMLIIEKGEPKRLYGVRGIKSELDKILQRVTEGNIQPKKIVIEFSVEQDDE